MKFVLPLCLLFAACSGSTPESPTTEEPAPVVAKAKLPQLQYIQIGPS